jgi:cytochrome c peroxidase
MKGPILHALAVRAPYFHNGSAALGDVVNFYDERFSIGFTAQEKADLLAFSANAVKVPAARIEDQRAEENAERFSWNGSISKT